MSGHFPLCFPEITLIEKQTKPVLVLSILSQLLCIDTTIGPGEREISCATDITAKGCSETAVFRLMSTGCFPGSVPHGENLMSGKRGEESNQIIFMVSLV